MKRQVILLQLLALQLFVGGCILHASQIAEGEARQPAKNSRLASRQWRAAVYRGLTMGTSTRADVTRVLGQPTRVDTPFDAPKSDPHPEEWYVYDVDEEIPGALTIIMDKTSGVLLSIDLEPQNLFKEDAMRHFGDDYVVTRYDFDQCLGNGESAPLYESPDGAIEQIEYRDKGIAIAYTRENKVNRIIYVSKPFGSPASKCKKQDENR